MDQLKLIPTGLMARNPAARSFYFEHASDLKTFTRGAYSTNCAEESYPDDGCKHLRLHLCRHHTKSEADRARLMNSLGGVDDEPASRRLRHANSTHTLQVQGPGLCDTCRTRHITPQTLAAFYKGVLDYKVRDAQADAPGKHCQLLIWRCTQCESVGRAELKLCNKHEKSHKIAAKLRAGHREPAVVAASNDCVSVDVGRQPTCVNDQSTETLRNLVVWASRFDRRDVEYDYLPQEAWVRWTPNDKGVMPMVGVANFGMPMGIQEWQMEKDIAEEDSEENDSGVGFCSE